MNTPHSTSPPRQQQQQQPQRVMNRQQQQSSGSQEFQAPRQIGEGVGAVNPIRPVTPPQVMGN